MKERKEEYSSTVYKGTMYIIPGPMAKTNFIENLKKFLHDTS